MSRREAGPGECGDACGGESSTAEKTETKVAGREPGAYELAEEGGGEESSGLRVLDMPACDERGKQRAQHDGDKTPGHGADEEGRELPPDGV